jgi:hypothetical protein
MQRILWLGLLPALAVPAAAPAAQLVFPQNRQAYYSSEPIELAVAGLAKGAEARVELVPGNTAFQKVAFAVPGDGSTVVAVLPPYALAPSAYSVKLDGKDAGKLTISSGVRDSTMLLSQTIGWDKLKPAGANFILGNAFGFGRLTPDGKGPLTTNLRNGRSGGLDVFERAVAVDLPTVVYMYWTGYVTHKPFGSEKSWPADDMNEAMRLLSFHTSQRLRRYAPNIVSVGCLDEPGLSWGKTPAGGMASGFPNRDEVEWYAARGWKYTDDPASRPADDWMKYMSIRCAIMKEQTARAAADLRASWPKMPFSTDLYAPQAVMDGTDPLNQQVNDFPSSHVFVDWGIDRLGAYSGVMLEKAHDPTSKLAHAMNGQLFGTLDKQPGQTHAYRAALNGMMAAGLASNWWLNTGGMSEKDLDAVNTPVKKVGALLHEFTQAGHDTAVLWSFTEICMREKDITAKEAKKKDGEQIKLMIASLPENTAIKNKEVSINAYNVGGDYKETVLTAHYALARAGYPAHIIDERLLPAGALKKYKTLVIAGQTFDLPKNVQEAIRTFIDGGGQVVVDRSTTVKFDKAIVADVDLKGLSYRWGALFSQDVKSFKTAREASLYQTNYFMDEPVRKAVKPFKKAMKSTKSVQQIETDSDDLLIERHVAGEGEVILIANGHKELPKVGPDEKYPIYNYAPLKAKYAAPNLKGVAYVLEGADWSKAHKVADLDKGIEGRFEPAEMKVYLIAPRAPAGYNGRLSTKDNTFTIEVSLKDLKMPWPLTVTLRTPDGKVLYQVHRATSASGTYQETFPIGSNAAKGKYEVEVNSPLANIGFRREFDPTPSSFLPDVRKDSVRVFDEDVIRKFLADKPALTIAFADKHKADAEKLAKALTGHGLKVTLKPEADVLKKVAYPRVWNPYAQVYRSKEQTKDPLEGKKVDQKITLGVDRDGNLMARTADGKDVSNDWRLPNSAVTIDGEGYVDWNADREICYEPKVVLYVNDKRQVTVVQGEAKEEATTAEFRKKWARPWTRLTTHQGAYQLPAELPEAYTVDGHLIVLGDSTSSKAVAVLQASDLLLQVADDVYPGPGKALLSFAWSPFAVEKNVIVLAATDTDGIQAGSERLVGLAPR